MATKKKLLEAAAGSAGGAGGLNVEDVFSSWLYTGNDSTTGQTIQNGIDYTDGTDRLVIVRARNDAKSSVFNDTVRGAPKNMAANSNTGENTEDVFNFASNGFTVKHTTTGTYAYCTNRGTSPSGATKYSALTFTKAEKFFTIVEYTGDGNSTKTISHDLGVSPAVVIVKNRNFGSWGCSMWTPTRRRFLLNYNGASDVASTYDEGSVTSRTSTDFTVQKYSTQGYTANRNGDSYVAYLFAGNDGDGIFGETGDQDIIKVGEYTGDGTSDLSNKIDLGFEPDFVWVKCITNSGDHYWYSNPAGMGADKCSGIRYNTLNTEASNIWGVYSTGFAAGNTANDTSQKYAYVAIRRPMAVPTDATDVFAMDTRGTGTQPPAYHSGFPVDMALSKYNSAGWEWLIGSRLTQATTMQTNSTVAESGVAEQVYDYMDGYYNSTNTSTTYLSWMWKRAPSFFDVVAYTGNGTWPRNITHNLGVAPEMMWIKPRDLTGHWLVYHSGLNVDGDNAPETDYIILNSTAAAVDSATLWNDTAPTDTVFTLGSTTGVNASGYNYIAYLFASLDGVSKVGSYTGNGSTQTIDCGFSAGARFILIKRTDSTGDWYVWDTERGIVAANDPHLSLNTTAAQVTTDDSIDPVSSGFAVNQVSATNINVSSASYIYYAVS